MLTDGTYKNAMELLVEEEVDQQIKNLPSRSTFFVKRVELITYALNQLPPLYASTHEGLNYQLQKGRLEHNLQIQVAVRRAFAAIQRDPLRTGKPLQISQEKAKFHAILNRLRLILRDEKVEWDTLPAAVEKTLSGFTQRSNTPQNSHVQNGPSRSRPSVLRPPQNVNQTVKEIPLSQSQAASTDHLPHSSGWDNPFYNL